MKREEGEATVVQHTGSVSLFSLEVQVCDKLDQAINQLKGVNCFTSILISLVASPLSNMLGISDDKRKTT